MPSPYRSSFPALTFTIVALSLLAFLKLTLTPYLGPAAVNDMVNESAPFLNEGAEEPIEWQVFSLDTLRKAKREDLPVFLFMGTGWSAAARRIDLEILSDPDVYRCLARNFVCARLDLDARPSWVSAFLPLSRGAMKLNPTCQMYVLSPDGSLVAPIDESGLWSMANTSDTLDSLISALKQYRSSEDDQLSSSAGTSLAVSPQQADISAMTQELNQFVSESQIQSIVDSSSSGAVAGSRFNYQTLRPNTWQFDAFLKGANAGQAQVNPVLVSPTVNWIDGGFFFGSAGSQWKQPVYDQPAIINSEMALLLARLWAITKNPYDRYLATKTVDVLLGDFQIRGLISAARIGDEQPRTFRSKRFSVPPRQLRALFPNSAERRWAWDNLNLRVEKNPPMLPYVSQPTLIQTQKQELESHLDIIANGAAPSQFDSIESADVCGQTAANLSLACSILGLEDEGRQSAALCEQMFRFYSQSDVLHTQETNPSDPKNLVDYLSAAKACLDDFQVLGRLSSLGKARALMNRAISIFPASMIPKLPSASSQSPLRDAMPDTNCPQIADDVGTSTTALYLNVCWNLACIDQNAADHEIKSQALDWRQRALSVSQSALPAALSLGNRAGGFFFQRALIKDGRFAVAVGPDPMSLASRLRQSAPWFPVIPAVGSVWPSLQARKPGIYIFINGQVTGPFQTDQAAKILNTITAQ